MAGVKKYEVGAQGVRGLGSGPLGGPGSDYSTVMLKFIGSVCLGAAMVFPISGVPI